MDNDSTHKIAEDKWTERHMALARLISLSSKDPTRKVGAIIVDHERRLVGSGYNGFPRGVNDHAMRYSDKMIKSKLVVHAEVNAILNSTIRLLTSCTMYTTSFPCSECAKIIVQSGLSRVITASRAGLSQRWIDDAYWTVAMFDEASVELVELP